MFPISGAFGGQIAGGIHDSAAGFFNASDQRLALANRVTGNESPQELIAIHQRDKELALQQVKNKFEYEYLNAWQEANERLRKKNKEQRQRLFDMGAIFA